MNKSKLLVLAAAPMMLASCNGISKVKFEKFQEKVKAIDASGVKLEKTTIKGKFADEKFNFVVGESTDLKNVPVALVVAGVGRVEVAAVAESENMSYYVGMGFKTVGKVDGEKMTICWDKYGNVTKIAGKMDGKATNLTVSYKYSK